MEFVRCELSSDITFPSSILRIIVINGVLFCALASPTDAIELWSPKGKRLSHRELPSEPRCLLHKDQWVFCALKNGNILVLSAEDGSILHTIEEAHVHMFSNSLALWGPFLISCGYFDGKVRWWRLGSWEAVGERESRVGACSPVVSPSGVLAVGGDKDIALFDAESGQPKAGGLIRRRIDTVLCLVWLDEHCLVSGSGDKDIRVWDVVSGSCLATLKGHTDAVNDLALRGPILASASYDTTVRLWYLKTHQCLQVIKGHRDTVYCVLFSGPNFLSGGRDKRLLTWKGGYHRMSRESLLTLLLCHKYGSCLALSCIPMDVIKTIVRMVDDALMWGEE